MTPGSDAVMGPLASRTGMAGLPAPTTPEGSDDTPSPSLFAGREFLRFALRFAMLFLLIFVLLRLAPQSHIEAFNRLTALLTAHLLQAVGLEPTLRGDLVSLGGFHARIIGECTALPAMALFCAFVLAYPAPALRKAAGLVTGLPCLFMVNLARLSLVIIAGAYFPEAFTAVHDALGQVVIVLATVLLCLGWVARATGWSARPAPAFVARVLLFGMLGLLAWLVVGSFFALAVYSLANGVLAVLGVPFAFDPPAATSEPGTLNLVTLASLVLASRSMSLCGKARALGLGFSVLTLLHVARRVAHGLLVAFGPAPVFEFFVVVAGYAGGQLAAPLLLWLGFHPGMRHWLWPSSACPICGQAKRGLRAHILAKHGPGALDRPEVKRVLTMRKE
jgi:exosortase/archaeosortase family protein